MGGRARRSIGFGRCRRVFEKLGGLAVTVEGRHVAEERFTSGRRMKAFGAWCSSGGVLEHLGLGRVFAWYANASTYTQRGPAIDDDEAYTHTELSVTMSNNGGILAIGALHAINRGRPQQCSQVPGIQALKSKT